MARLWITTVRDGGSEFDRTLALRRESAEGTLAAPRIFVYSFFNADPAPRNASEARRGVRELKAKGADGIKFGTTSSEHWYGIPDAALDNDEQNFPPGYNDNDEADRFRYAGRLWREANWDRLLKVLDAMVAAHVAWDPTLEIYDAIRDLQRARTQPWFADYLHPALEEFLRPNPANHGSYFSRWTSTYEAFWKVNYRLWMAALRECERRGG